MSSNILANRDTNAKLPSPEKEAGKDKPKSMEFHRQVLESRMKSGQAQQTFISPSDQILSPATQKVNAYRNKHAMKKSKPQTLFAKTSSKNLEAAKSASMSNMFEDIPKDNATSHTASEDAN
ncbi:uncharacterized protein BDZ99DRAFT_415529 [Mytilinidion resinicola]|uniref:Spo12-like protein n=1 Tax=Mytilinidion resinicola TaxID=574789 RepID=A0A6A6YQD6_9PEZI|nr:uncharacterized protein BDZ99DRAFT_415529 [Mytilinidion resinicola]KAF2811112.1 hypothetical protein BDZ99DRAFT_415529 [Mytilinidion resinicola]